MKRRTFIASAASSLAMATGSHAATDKSQFRQSAADTILIRNGVIVPMDGKNRTLYDQAVLIEGNRIAAIGDAAELMDKHVIDSVIDAGGKAVMPGFVNAHTHTADVVMRGLAEDMDHIEYSELAGSIEVALNEEDKQCFARLGSIELLKFGNTCVNELGAISQEATAQAFHDTGIRGIVAPDITDISEDLEAFATGIFTPDAAFKKKKIAEAVEILDKWHVNEESLVTVRLANYIPTICTEETLKETKALADDYGTGVNSHAGFGEGASYRERFKKSEMAYLADIGYLDKNTALIHMLKTEEDEFKPFKESGAWMVHCPFEMAKRGMSASMDSIYKAGVNVALGSDWLMFDPFEQMRYAAVVARLSSGDMGIKKAYDFLAMATILSAEALGLDDEIGSLEVGKKADIILVDFDQAHISPMNKRYDLVTNLVYNAHGSDVTTVIVDGKVVVNNGKITTIDEAETVHDANQRSDIAIARSVGKTSA